MNKDTITVTSPLLPDLDEFLGMLKEIWESKWVTNNGQFHKQQSPRFTISIIQMR